MHLNPFKSFGILMFLFNVISAKNVDVCKYERLEKTLGDKDRGKLLDLQFIPYNECQSKCDNNAECMNFEHCPKLGRCQLFDAKIENAKTLKQKTWYNCYALYTPCKKEDKNQRGNSNPGRIGVSENIIIKSTPKVTAENTTNVITNTPKQLTPITESIIDIGSLSTLTFPEVIQNETSNPNDEQTTDTEQGTCVQEVANICKHMRGPCFPTLAYEQNEVYKILCEIADCKLSDAARLCPDKCAPIAPTWITEPKDTTKMLGDSVSIKGCFHENTTAISNHAKGEHNFRDIHTPEECQVKCQESVDCQYFVLYLKGRWKGCLLKTSGAKQTVKPHKHAIFGPKYCQII